MTPFYTPLDNSLARILPLSNDQAFTGLHFSQEKQLPQRQPKWLQPLVKVLSAYVQYHRATDSNGSLTGYAGGLPLKQAILKFEEIHINL